jgi:hypothetical protein
MKNRREWIMIFVAGAAVVFAISYTMIDRIMLRAAQLANNNMDVEYDSRSLIYALSITAAFSVLFYFFSRDISDPRS